MISSDPSEQMCPDCGGPTALRPLAPYPVWTQSVFAISFLAFLLTYDKILTQPWLIRSWAALQAGLGIVLIRRRLRAKKRILRCIRCSKALP